MKLQVYNHNSTRGGHSNSPHVTITKNGRIYINTELRKKLGIVNNEVFQAYLAYDEETQNIAIGRVGAVKVDEGTNWVTFKPTNHYTASISGFLHKFKIHIKDVARYHYIELWNGWFILRREDLLMPGSNTENVVIEKKEEVKQVAKKK